MKPKSKLSRREFAYTETSSMEVNQRLLTSTDSLYDKSRELDDEPTEEDTFSCTSWGLEWMNNCVPHRNSCLACYDAVRSIPPISMVSIAIAATGYGVSVTNTTLLLSNMANCGVNLKKYKNSMDAFGLCLFLVNGLIVVTSYLLSGWTREALCRCLQTGVFTRQNGNKTECGIFATIFSNFGMALLRLLMLAGYTMWLACALVLITVFSSYIVLGYLGDWACSLGEVHAASLFEILSRPFPEFQSINEGKFCSRSWKVRSEMYNISVGFALCLCAQVNFLCIVVHNKRTARLEQRREEERNKIATANLSENNSTNKKIWEKKDPFRGPIDSIAGDGAYASI